MLILGRVIILIFSHVYVQFTILLLSFTFFKCLSFAKRCVFASIVKYIYTTSIIYMGHIIIILWEWIIQKLQYVKVPNLMSLYIGLFQQLRISTCFGHSLPILKSDFSCIFSSWYNK
jgi:hypothetical protein